MVSQPKSRSRRSGLRSAHSGVRVFWLCLLCGLAPWGLVHAQVAARENRVTYSSSGQFIVPPARPGGASLNLKDPDVIQLSPSLVAISCERIKQTLWRKLEADGVWRGKIYVPLYPARTAEDPIVITSESFRDGWQYQVALPDTVGRRRYVAAVIQVLLLEMANRGAGTHAAEIPVWLTTGLTQELLATSEARLILTRPDMPANGLTIRSTFDAERRSPLEWAHQELTNHAPLTFEQLSWPTEPQLAGDGNPLYRASAQVFVHQLLQFTNGPACLREMLNSLPRYYNWQFAFLRAYGDHFQRLVEVEKWWALQSADFTGRTLSDTWNPRESWRKLDELLGAPVQVRTSTNELPLHTTVPLQAIVRDWKPGPQAEMLRSKIYQLQMLRLRLAPEAASLVDGYCQTLQAFLTERDNPGLVLPFRKAAALRHLKEETARNLDLLDTRRAALGQPEKPAVPMQAKAEPAPRRQSISRK